MAEQLRNWSRQEVRDRNRRHWEISENKGVQLEASLRLVLQPSLLYVLRLSCL